jgi:MFS family permease
MLLDHKKKPFAMTIAATAASVRTTFSENRYGWLVVGLMFAMLSLVMTARSSLGVLMPVWEQELGWSRRFVSTGGAVMMVTIALSSPAAGLLLDRVGARILYTIGLAMSAATLVLTAAMTEPWHFIASFCIFGGVAFATISAPLASTTAALYFETNRGLATGVASAGSSAGQLVLIPLLSVLVIAVGWREGMASYAAAIVAVAVAIWLLVHRQPGGRRVTDHAPFTARVRRLSRDRTFWLLAVGFVVCGFTTAGTIKVHLIPYAVTCGIPPLESATAFGVLSAFSLAGMVLYGWLADRFHRPILLASIYALRSLTFLLLMSVGNDVTLLFLFAVLFGIFDYSTFPLVASMVASHFGIRIMGFTMGLLSAAHAFGGAAGSFLGGYLFDLFARYDWVWIVSLLLAVFAAVVTLFIREDREAPSSTVAATA